MREKDLRAKFKQIDPDQVPGGLPMIRIIEEACVDLHRLADALEEVNASKARYFYHAESDSLIYAQDGIRPGDDPLLEEITEADYNRIRDQQAKKKLDFNPLRDFRTPFRPAQPNLDDDIPFMAEWR